MSIDNEIQLYIETNTKNATKQEIEFYNNSLIDVNNREKLSLTQYLTVGEILKPNHEFKVYIGNTLHSMDKKDLLIIYRIISKYKDHIHPVFFDDGIPMIMFLYYKDAKVKFLKATTITENLTSILITRTISQLTMISCSCSTLGKLKLT